MHQLFQAFEVAIVHVGLHKFGPWTHVHIAQCGYLELAVELRCKLNPFRIWIQLTAQAFQLAQEKSHARIHERRSTGVGTIAALVGHTLVVEL